MWGSRRKRTNLVVEDPSYAHPFPQVDPVFSTFWTCKDPDGDLTICQDFSRTHPDIIMTFAERKGERSVLRRRLPSWGELISVLSLLWLWIQEGRPPTAASPMNVAEMQCEACCLWHKLNHCINVLQALSKFRLDRLTYYKWWEFWGFTASAVCWHQKTYKTISRPQLHGMAVRKREWYIRRMTESEGKWGESLFHRTFCPGLGARSIVEYRAWKCQTWQSTVVYLFEFYLEIY